jgi:Spy/CpxP family protein refolding chaperone
MKRHLMLSVALALATGSMLTAQPFHPGPPPFGELRALDLTEAQQLAIHAIMEKHRDAHMTREKALRTQEKALMDAMTDPTSTDAQLRTLHTAASEARFTLLMDERATMLEIQTILTPAQQARAKELRQQPPPMGDEPPPPMP